MPLPLQIFEERYRVMTRELLERDGEFGVLLIREGPEVGGGAVPYEIGTTAAIEQWQEAPGGRFLITARGRRRFRLVRMLAPRPYPFGDVELMDDVDPAEGDPAFELAEQVRANFPAYFELALSLTDQWARGMRLPRTPHALVNFLAPWLQAEEMEKQHLLEVPDARGRVALLLELLERLLEKTRTDAQQHRLRKYHGFGSRN
jgi:Lon protease-like protein